MPDQLDQNVRRVPGESCMMTMRTQPRADASPAATTAAMAIRFNQVKHLLSDKPLRRPNRTRPLGR